MILISACFVNVNCRYDGTSKTYEWIKQLFESGRAIPVCPEVLGGLTIPRLPCEIVGPSIVVNSSGEDCSEAFVLGAERTLAIAKSVDAKIAILKANSPSCGYGFVYNGSFSGVKTVGNGLTAELLSEHGIRVFCESDEAQFLEFIKDAELSEN